jgi:hypothetical protein
MTSRAVRPSSIRGRGVNTYVWPKRATTQTWDVETMLGTKVGEIDQEGSVFAVSSITPLLLASLSPGLYRSKAEAMSAIGLHLKGRCENGGNPGRSCE